MVHTRVALLVAEVTSTHFILQVGVDLYAAFSNKEKLKVPESSITIKGVALLKRSEVREAFDEEGFATNECEKVISSAQKVDVTLPPNLLNAIYQAAIYNGVTII